MGDGVRTLAPEDTRVLFIRGGGTAAADTLGSQTTTAIELNNGNNSVTVRNGDVKSIIFDAGNDTVTGGSGSVDFINFNNWNNLFTDETGFVGSVFARDGNDTVTLQNGADLISLESGNNTVPTGAGYMGVF